MQPALIENVETVIILTAMIAVPNWTALLCWLLAGLVSVTVGQRVVRLWKVSH